MIDLSQLAVDYKPHFPTNYQPGIGIIGCGGIVRGAHLPAYQKFGVNVVGVYDISPDASRQAHEQFGVHVFSSLEELLDHPDIKVVDIATHPSQRVSLIRRALEAGKHVLSQKPFAPDMQSAQALVDLAQQLGLKLAVNQNGRFSPAWRMATLFIEQGLIGEVMAVTHMFEFNFAWITGTVFDTIPHCAIYDYAIHWIDSTRCWLDQQTLSSVRAREYRTPNQPAECHSPCGMWAEFSYANGAHAMIRGINCTDTKRLGHPFWIHGSNGTIRGSTLGNDFIELEHAGSFQSFTLEGSWFPDGFAGTMGELLSSIAEEREPSNSARHNLLTLQMTLAACQSSENDGAPAHFNLKEEIA